MDNLITIDFEGVNFNATALSKKTKEDFVKQGLKEGKYAEFETAKRKEILGDAWKAIKDAVKEAPSAETGKPATVKPAAPKPDEANTSSTNEGGK